MSERSKNTSVLVPFLFASTVLAGGFGGGVLLGWGTRKHTPTSTNTRTESMSDAEVKSELAACKAELKAAKKARDKGQVAAMLEGMNDAGLEGIAKIEALQKNVHECQVRETLENGYVCGTIGDHRTLYMVLVHGMSCADPPGIGQYLLNSVDKCAEFTKLDDYPAHIDKDKLTERENARLIEAKWRRKVTKDNEDWGLKQTLRECRRIWALPPE